MPKLHHTYWMCRCGWRGYAEILHECPNCHRKHNLRYLLDATVGTKTLREDTSVDPFLGVDIRDLGLEVVAHGARGKEYYREKARRERLRAGHGDREAWPWDHYAGGI